MSGLRGRVALMTGATGGVGTAIAKRLLDRGACVCLVGRSRAALDRHVDAHEWKDHVECYEADLDQESGVDALAAQIIQRHASLDVLIHCAGAIVLGRVHESRVEDLDMQFRVNVRAPYRLTQAVLPQLIAARGQIVFINSSAGVQAREGMAQYAASKHALRAVADTIRHEVNPSGVRVLSVFLGRTASKMQEAVHAHEQQPYRPERLIQADDVAALVVNAMELPPTAEVTDIHVRPMLKG